MKKSKYLLVLGLPLMIMATSCEKFEDFGDTNVNPGATTQPNYAALLTNVETQIGGYATESRGGLYAQYFSETQYTDASLYALPQLSFTGNYSGPLADLQNIINSNVSNNMTQISRILQQYIFWNMTDKWGPIPYSEALKGIGNTNPKYDDQESIYKGMIETLKSAVNAFDGSAISGDVINNGVIEAWKRHANSMRLLMALQLSERFPAASDYAATEFKAALNHPAGVIESNVENFDVNYPGGGFKSPLWSTYDGRKDLAESKTMTDLLTNLNDLRGSVYGGANEDPSNTTASTVGVPYGLARASAEAFTSNNPTWARVFRGDYRQENGTVTVIGAAQVLFARAEAADRGWTSESVAELYKAAIEASFNQWRLPPPSAAYLSQAGVALTATPGTGGNLKQIATQAFIAGYPNGLYAWNLWRRTGFPELTPAPDATNDSGEIPRRYVYATSEYATNKASVEAAVATIPGGDTQDSKVWWDVN